MTIDLIWVNEKKDKRILREHFMFQEDISFGILRAVDEREGEKVNICISPQTCKLHKRTEERFVDLIVVGGHLLWKQCFLQGDALRDAEKGRTGELHSLIFVFLSLLFLCLERLMVLLLTKSFRVKEFCYIVWNLRKGQQKNYLIITLIMKTKIIT